MEETLPNEQDSLNLNYSGNSAIDIIKEITPSHEFSSKSLQLVLARCPGYHVNFCMNTQVIFFYNDLSFKMKLIIFKFFKLPFLMLEQLKTRKEWTIDLASNSFHTADCYNNSFQITDSENTKCRELEYVTEIRSVVKFAK